MTTVSPIAICASLVDGQKQKIQGQAATFRKKYNLNLPNSTYGNPSRFRFSTSSGEGRCNDERHQT